MNYPRFTLTAITLIIISLSLNSCIVARFTFYTFADVRDYKKFPKRTMHNDGEKYVFPTAKKENFPKLVKNKKNEDVDFEKYIAANRTVAFLVIKNDTIRYEKYFHRYNRESIVPSFSVAKSITSILVGCAIDDGLIKSVDEPITNYVPELKKNGLEKVTIKHLLQMTSGIKFNESYVNPFGEAGKFYYGRHLEKRMSKMTMETEPGKKFKYISGGTELLGWVLTRALKTKTITQYLQEKIWQPLGMEYDGTWSIDQKKDGIEKTFCCVNARARDFAKIGRLYKNKGVWNGKRIVSENWVRESTKIDTSEGSAVHYQYQWWLPSKNGDFLAVGHLGQYIYVNPEKNIVIVRLGKAKRKKKVNWKGLFSEVIAYYEK